VVVSGGPNESDALPDRGSVVLSFILLGILGVSAFLSLPVLISGFATDFSFTDQQVGSISAVQLAGIGVGCLINLWLIRRLDWRAIGLIAVFGLLLADGASIFLRDYYLVLAARCFAGACGGLGVSLTTRALSLTRLPDRNFGIFLSGQVLFSIVALSTFPRVIQGAGFSSVFAILVALEVLTLIFVVPRIPKARPEAVVNQRESSPTDRLTKASMAMVLMAIVLFFCAIGGFWTFIERIGRAGGLSAKEAGFALGLASLGGLAGGLLATFLHVRVGRALPLAAGAVVQLVGLSILVGGFSFFEFAAAIALFQVGWFATYPYQLGLLAAVDSHGRAVLVSPALTGFGLALGPLLVAPFLGSTYVATYVVALAGLVLAQILIQTAAYFQSRSQPATVAQKE
jgi:predicted MFS family arabinose efflux permease